MLIFCCQYFEIVLLNVIDLSSGFLFGHDEMLRVNGGDGEMVGILKIN